MGGEVSDGNNYFTAASMTTTMPRIISTAVAALTIAVPAMVQAREIHVSAAVPLAPIECHVFDKGFVSNTTGPCTNFEAPAALAVGASFSESGNHHVITVIKAMQAEADMPEISLKTGEWMCTAAESESDLGNRRLSHRMWLYIPKCTPR
jgi:hypothetical protein